MFFRAGVLGQMEEFRDERLGKIMSWMQAWIRGYLSRKEYKKIQEQRLALQVVQRNLRKYMQLRTWPWWKLWQKVKPLLNVTRVEDEIAVSRNKKKKLNFRTYTGRNQNEMKCAPLAVSLQNQNSEMNLCHTVLPSSSCVKCAHIIIKLSTFQVEITSSNLVSHKFPSQAKQSNYSILVHSQSAYLINLASKIQSSR